MSKFSVEDMYSRHCLAAIERAIKSEDAGARVRFDLNHRTVCVDSDVSAKALQRAIATEGYRSTKL